MLAVDDAELKVAGVVAARVGVEFKHDVVPHALGLLEVDAVLGEVLRAFGRVILEFHVLPPTEYLSYT